MSARCWLNSNRPSWLRSCSSRSSGRFRPTHHRCRVHIQFVGLVLGEITNLSLGARDRAQIVGEAPGQQPDERRFAVSVGTDQCNAIVFVEPEGQVFQHRCTSITDCGVEDAEQRRRKRWVRVGKLKVTGGPSENSGIGSILSDILIRDWACFALVALYRKRSTTFVCARCASCFERARAFCSNRIRREASNRS